MLQVHVCILSLVIRQVKRIFTTKHYIFLCILSAGTIFFYAIS